MTGLLRSGWWVAAVAAAILVGTLAWLVRPGPSSIQGDGADPATYGFDLSCAQYPPGSLIGGGMSRDGLQALDHPTMIAGSEVAAVNEEQRGKLLVSADRVIGVASKGEAKAYPLRLMRWHEVVNDTLAGQPIVVTYSGLCDASAVWSRSIDSADSAFAVSGLVHDSNSVIYDSSSATPSLWSQLTGQALAGPAACAGLKLSGLPAEVVSWTEWYERHPETLVLTPLPELKRLYKRDPYHSYFGSEKLHFPVDPEPPENGPAAKDHVVILEHLGERRVVLLSDVEAVTRLRLGGRSVTLNAAKEPATAQAGFDDPDTTGPNLRLAFWFAWHAQNPEDTLWTPSR